jgi:hypothetical protein
MDSDKSPALISDAALKQVRADVKAQRSAKRRGPREP